MWYDRIKSFYKKGYYTRKQVQLLVPKFISQEEADEILKARK